MDTPKTVRALGVVLSEPPLLRSRVHAETKLSDSEVEMMLGALAEHFKQPVLPLRRFCDAIQTWGHRIEKLHPDRYKPDAELNGHGASYARELPRLFVDIEKSNLLARLLYDGEKLREEPCPLHEGHWSGCFGGCIYGCCSGSNVTGWLRPESEQKKQEDNFRTWLEQRGLDDQRLVIQVHLNKAAADVCGAQGAGSAAFEEWAESLGRNREVGKWGTSYKATVFYWFLRRIGHVDLVPEKDRHGNQLRK